MQVAETEIQIITHFEVFDERPRDRALLTSAVEEQQRRLGRVPHLVTADAGQYAQAHQHALEQMGVKRVAVPNRNAHRLERKKMEKSRWFKKAWRTGYEGRISVVEAQTTDCGTACIAARKE